MDSIALFSDYSLRSLRAGDTPDIFAAIDTQREHLGHWLPFVALTHHVGQTREVVARMRRNSDNPVFTLRAGNVFAGLIGFKESDTVNGTIEIGYWLREEYQGRGIMTAAVQALCEYAFTELGMRTVSIRCGTGNLRSNNIPRRLGFRLDRVEPRGEELTGGEWIDLNVYLLQRPES